MGVSRSRLWLALWGGWLAALAACAGEDGQGAQLVLTLISADEAYGAGGRLPIRANNELDRTRVDSVTCEVLDSARTAVGTQTVAVEQTTYQEVYLEDLPPGQGYYARMRGYEGETVFQCAVVGPFDLQAGEKHFAAAVLVWAQPEDPDCSAFCSSQEDCASLGLVCLSPCAQDGAAAVSDCKLSQCFPPFVGNACTAAVPEDCGKPSLSLTCNEFPAYPGGYCSATCASDSQCIPGSTCATAEKAQLSSAICAKRCETQADCRSGYECLDAGHGKTACLPPSP
jgi:hypothetical protein